MKVNNKLDKIIETRNIIRYMMILLDITRNEMLFKSLFTRMNEYLINKLKI